MRILVISHNVFSRTTNMGKTLSAYFNHSEKDDIAQFYVYSETPTENFCANYYRITDKDIIKSVFTRKSGTIFLGPNVASQNGASNSAATSVFYQKGRSRTPLIYLARNLWWRLGAWKTKKLLKWVDDFDPNIIFLASGDYSFIYRIALKLAQYKNIPLVVSCMDDYYFFNKNENKFLGKTVHRAFMKQVRKTMEYASAIFSICEKMSEDYCQLFKKPCYTLHTPSMISGALDFEKSNAISYIGNLGYKRNEQLVNLGKTLKGLNCKGRPDYIDVYSMESDSAILKDLTKENGIRFHGGISSDEVLEVIGKSMAVIHTEAFDPDTTKRVAYSVSTKIADSLASGTCMLAYGPMEVASIKYLRENNAAFCVTEEDDLGLVLEELIANAEKRKEVAENALALAKKNHNSETNCDMILKTLEALCCK